MSDPPHDTVPAESDRLLDAVLDAAASLIVVVTPAGELVRWNRACERLLGYTADELRGGNGLQLLVPEDEHERVREALAALGRGESPVPVELHWRTKGGELRQIAWSNTALTAPDGRVSHVVATGIDVTDARAMEQRLRRLADYDALTGLVNRRRFEEELNRHLARGHRYGLEGSLLVLDLDNFKQINDSHGHREGDRVLSAVAGALALRMRESDTVGRIGGDEFAVLLPRGGRAEAQTGGGLAARGDRRRGHSQSPRAARERRARRVRSPTPSRSTTSSPPPTPRCTRTSAARNRPAPHLRSV